MLLEEIDGLQHWDSIVVVELKHLDMVKKTMAGASRWLQIRRRVGTSVY